MKNKAIHIIMALTLCVGAFLFPTAAYAATDTTPPTVRAWINGDLLHVEAFDDTGVEAAYINSARVYDIVEEYAASLLSEISDVPPDVLKAYERQVNGFVAGAKQSLSAELRRGLQGKGQP